MQKVKKLKVEKYNEGKELNIYSPQGHYTGVSENKSNGLTIVVNEEKSEHLEVIINGKKVYENYDEKTRAWPKKLWPLMQSVRWDTNSNGDFYFYNQYGRDILVTIEDNGLIKFKVDDVHIPNLKEVYPDITEEEMSEITQTNELIHTICKMNGYSFDFSHFMESECDEGCWSDIVVPTKAALNLDAINYLFLLNNKMEVMGNTIYNKYKK